MENDYEITIYFLQHSHNDYCEWETSNMDYFSIDKDFCDRYGEFFGFTDKDWAIKVLNKVRKNFPDTNFRIIECLISQKTISVIA